MPAYQLTSPKTGRTYAVQAEAELPDDDIDALVNDLDFEAARAAGVQPGVDPAVLNQRSLGTFASSLPQTFAKVGSGMIGGAGRLLDKTSEALSQATGLPKGGGMFQDMARYGDDLATFADITFPTNPQNKVAGTVGSGAAQGLSLLAGGIAGKALTGSNAAMTVVPAASGFLSGSNEGIQTAERVGVQSPLAQLGVGAAFGGIEVLTERLGGIGSKAGTQALTNAVRQSAGQMLKTSGKAVGSEAFEEVLAGRSQAALTRLIASEDPNNPGYTRTGVKLDDLAREIVNLEAVKLEALGGAAGGTVFAGAQVLANRQLPTNDQTPPNQAPAAPQSPTPTPAQPVAGAAAGAPLTPLSGIAQRGGRIDPTLPEDTGELTVQDLQTLRQGDSETVSESPPLPVSESPSLPVSPSPSTASVTKDSGPTADQTAQVVPIQEAPGAGLSPAAGTPLSVPGTVPVDVNNNTQDTTTDEKGNQEGRQGQGLQVTQPPQVPAQDPAAAAASPPAAAAVRTPEQIAESQRIEAERQAQEARLRMIDNKAQGMPLIPDSPSGSLDILDFANENPIYLPPGFSEQRNLPEYEKLKEAKLPPYWRQFIASGKRGGNPTDVAQRAFDAGLIAEPTADAYLEGLRAGIAARQQYRVQFKQREKALQAEERQVVNFEKSQDKLAKKPDAQEIPFEDVLPGDEMTIDGEAAVVRNVEYNEDGYLTNVVIEDGKRFGLLQFDPQTRGGILVDEYQPRAARNAVAADEFAPEDAPSPSLPVSPSPSLDSLLQGTESTRPRNRGETTRAQNADPLGELATAKRAGEANQAQGRIALSRTPSRQRPKNQIVFQTPIPTSAGLIRSYSWASKIEEVQDKTGEIVEKRFSDWDKAVTNAETGRDIVHQFDIEKPDGTITAVSLESALGKLTPEVKKSTQAVIRAARRLPLRQAELEQLQTQLAAYDAAIQTAQQSGWQNAPEPRLETPDFPPLAERGVKAVYVGQQFIKNLESSELNQFNDPRLIVQWKRQWAVEQVPRPPYGSRDRIEVLKRGIRKDLAELQTVQSAPSPSLPVSKSQSLPLSPSRSLDNGSPTSLFAYDARPENQLTPQEREALRILRAEPEFAGNRIIPVRITGVSSGVGGTQRGADNRARAIAAWSDAFSRLFGKRILFVSGAPATLNGAVAPGQRNVLIVNVEGSDPLLYILGHELTHSLRAQNPTLYAALEAEILAGGRDLDSYRQRLTELGYQPEELNEELVADFIGAQMLEPEFLNRISQEKPTLFQRFAQAVVKFINGLLAKAQTFGRDIRPHFQDNLEALRDTLAKALRTYAESGQFPDNPLGDSGTVDLSNESGNGVTAQQDAEYLAAVQAGDMETAQRLVDAAAKRAGFDVKAYHGTTATTDVLIEGQGPSQGYEEAVRGLKELAAKFGVSEWSYTDAYQRMLNANYGGITQADVDRAKILKRQYLDSTEDTKPDSIEKKIAFNVFNMPAGELEFGVHLGNQGAAGQFGEVFNFWAKLGKTIRLPDLGTWNYQSVIRELRKRKVPISESEYSAIFNSADPNTALRQLVRDKGIESIVYRNEAEGRGDSWIVTAPSQIKSADPVTYDNNGNVVPLSQRFNERSPDIRFSRTTAETQSRFAAPEAVDREYQVRKDAEVKAQALEWLARTDPEVAVEAFENNRLPSNLTDDVKQQAAGQLLMRLNETIRSGAEIASLQARSLARRLGRVWQGWLSQEAGRNLRQRSVVNAELTPFAPIMAAENILIDRADAVMDKRFEGGGTGAVEKIRKVETTANTEASTELAADLEGDTTEGAAPARPGAPTRKGQVKAKHPDLARMLNALRKKMAPGMTWADIFTDLPGTQKARQLAIYDRLLKDERLQGLTVQERVALTNELDKAWQRERRKVFKRELKKAGVIGEKSEADRAKVEKALPKLLRMINLGMMNSEMWREAVAPEYGLKTLSAADVAGLSALAEKAYAQPAGVLRNRLLRDLLASLQSKTGGSWVEIMNSYWTASVLSGLRTQFDTWAAATNGLGTNLVQLGSLLARGQGKAAVDAHLQWWRGLFDGVRESMQILRTGDTSYLKRFGADLRRALEGDTSSSQVPLGENLWRNGNLWQKYGMAPVMMFTGRLMAAADHINNTATTQGAIAVARALHPELYAGRTAFTTAEREAARQQALREVTGGVEPKTGEERATVSARTREILNGTVQADDYAAASEIGDMAAFQNDPTGIFGSAYHALKGGLGTFQRRLGDVAEDVTANKFSRAVTAVLAGSLHGLTGTRFMRFGFNFGAELTRYMPGSYVLGRAGFYGREVSQMQQELLLGKNLVGLMIVSTLAAMLGDDDDEAAWKIEGDWSSLTPQQVRERMSAGLDRMTMWKRENGQVKRVSYKQWPTMALFSVVGGMQDERRHQPERYAERGPAGHMLRAATTGMLQVKNVSAMRNLVEIFGENKFGGDPTQGMMDNVVRIGANYVGGLVPTVMKDAEIWTDPRNFKPEGVWEQMSRSMPILRKNINDGRPQLNILGEEVNLQRSPWSRTYTSTESGEAHRVLGALLSRGLSLPQPSAQVSVFQDGRKVPLESLGRGAVWKYEKAVGTAYKQWLATEGRALLQMPIEQADKVIQRKADSIKRQARARLTP